MTHVPECFEQLNVAAECGIMCDTGAKAKRPARKEALTLDHKVNYRLD